MNGWDPESIREAERARSVRAMEVARRYAELTGAVDHTKDAEVAHDGLVRITLALEHAVKYGGIDGDHHKAWVIDQMVRILAGPHYEALVRKAKAGDDGPDTYEWNEGIAP